MIRPPDLMILIIRMIADDADSKLATRFIGGFIHINGRNQNFHNMASLYYRVVVIRAPLQGLCYTVRDAVDWCVPPTTRWFSKGSNHSPLQFC